MTEGTDVEPDAAACTLCDLATGESPVTADDVPGSYCCRGCLEIARTLDDVESAAPDDFEAGDESAVQDDESEIPDDAERTFLAVEGMHCATCETFVSATATDAPGVHDAEASYATDAMRVVHDPDADLASLESRLDRYGYGVSDPDERDGDATSGDAELARFLIGGGIFAMMVMAWYVLFLYPTYLGFEPLVSLGDLAGLYLFGNVWLMSSIVLFYTGYPILRGAVVSLRAGQPNMDLLVALAAVSAYCYSTVAVLVGRTHVYFDVTVAIVVVVTLGNYYEDRIKRDAASGLSELTSTRVETARRVREDGTPESVPVADLDPGETVLVRPGERVPVDGTVLEGTAAVDESLVTGESVPETRRPGEEVLGGTVVTDDPLVVEVGADATSTLDRLVDLLWEIQSSRTGVQRLADTLATLFVPTVLALGVGATAWHLLGGAPVADALLAGLTVLVVSCPCALGLATPLAVASGIREATDRGIVVASDAVFETAPETDVVVLDKTGTLTDGAMAVQRVVVGERAASGARGPLADGGAVAEEPGVADFTDDAVLARAAALERYASHPIAEAIVATAGESSAGESSAAADDSPADDSPEPTEEIPDATAVETHDRGVTGEVAGAETVVGHPDLLAERGFDAAEGLDLDATVESARADGDVPVAVGWDGLIRGVVVVGDSQRENWDAVVSEIGQGSPSGARREVVVLTGDDEAAARRFGEHPAVSEVFAGVPPQAKAETVERLQSRGTVAMVGDGSNDAPALAAADLGVALASGTDLAADAADAIVVDGGLDAVPDVFRVARGTSTRIRRNLGWAFCYNAIAIPLALTGLLNPLFAAVAMGASSLLVVANSARSMG